MNWKKVWFLTVSTHFLNITSRGMSRSIALDSIKCVELPLLDVSKFHACIKLILLIRWEELFRLLSGQHQVIITLSTGEIYKIWIDENGLKNLFPFAEKF